MKNSIFTRLVLTLFLAFLFSNTAIAAKNPTYKNWSGHAIKGYDTVAYFTDKNAIKGSKDHSFEWNKATWLFSSIENLNKFKMNPEKYAPQYGGYCSYAAAKNSFAPVDPTQFTVLNAKLYLNYNKKFNEIWTANRDEFIIKADKNWPELLEKTK